MTRDPSLPPEPGDVPLKVFIAGTGRSGTTILHDLVGAHPDFHAVPLETRFIVEADGLSTLIPALTDRFSVTGADLALLRFMVLMGVAVPGMENEHANAEFGQHIRSQIGPDFFDPALQGFLDAVTGFTFNGFPFPRHFENRAELIGLARRMVSGMFGAPARAAGKVAWVEKTPSSVTEIDLLWEIFPEARILHIKRDPRGVLHSLMQQDWVPQEVGPATAFLRSIYWRWGQLKPRLNLPDPRYMELRLEDLCTRPDQVLAEVSAFLGLKTPIPGGKVNAAMADRWRHEMSAEHRRFAEDRLGDMFPLMGYGI